VKQHVSLFFYAQRTTIPPCSALKKYQFPTDKNQVHFSLFLLPFQGQKCCKSYPQSAIGCILNLLVLCEKKNKKAASHVDAKYRA